MRCLAAKNNPLLVKQAAAHYLNGTKENFCFISLWNDAEPYPLSELIAVLGNNLEQLKQRATEDIRAQYKEQIALNYGIAIGRAEKTLNKLIHIAELKATNKEQTQ